MKYTILTACLLLAFLCSFSQIRDWSRVAPGASSNMSGNVVAIDKWRNTIQVSTGNGFYLNKYNDKGTLMWSLLMDGTNLGRDLLVDNSGNIYLFSARFTQINGANIGSPSAPFLLSKFSPQGKLIWMRAVSQVMVNSLARKPVLKIDDQNRIYITLSASGTVTINGTTSVPSSGCSGCANDGIVAQMDTAGQVSWIRRLENSNNGLPPNGTGLLDMDVNHGEVLVSGFFEYSVKIGDTSLVDGGRAYFAAALNSTNGNRKWVQKFSGIDVSYPIAVNNTYKNNNPILFTSSRNFQFGTLSVSNTNTQATYLGMLDSLGRVRWLKPIGTDRIARGIYADTIGHYFLVANSTCLDCMPNSNFQIKRLDTSGNELYNLKPEMGVSDLALTPDGIVAVTGSFNNSILLGADTLTHQGQTDMSNPYLSYILGNANVVKGRAYFDFNSNNVFDAGDLSASQMLIKTQVPKFSAVTDIVGRYELLTDVGSYEVAPAKPIPYYTLSPDKHSVNMGSYGTLLLNKDFIWKPMPNVNDLVVHVSTLTPTRPGFQIIYQITYKNVGTTILSGTIGLKLDSLLTYQNSDSTPVFTAVDSISWNYTSLRPMQEHSIRLTATVAPYAQLSKTISTIGYIYPIQNDTTKSNNIDTLNTVTSGAFDPNDKSVFPFKNAFIEDVAANNQWLDYTVRFQNTGTDTAFNIHILDTLSSKLDPSSFEMISASHPMEVRLNQGNIFDFYFPNILLPDSNRNEPLSHGYVRYRVRPLTTLAVNDAIHNTASIYFDYNVPVITNDVTTQLISKPSVLPIRLLNFYGNQQNQRISLFWTTTNDAAYRFEVERSTEDNHFVKIGTVAANNLSNYSFTDSTVYFSSDTVLYRLKMVKSDGSYQYSNVLFFSRQTGASNVEVYPNPISNKASIAFTTAINGKAEMHLYSNTGVVIVKEQLNVQRGKNVYPLSHLSTLAPGVYFIRVIVDKEVKNGMFVIQ